MDRLATKLPSLDWDGVTRVPLANIIGQDIVLEDAKEVVSKFGGSMSLLFSNPTTQEKASTLTSSEVLIEKIKFAKANNMFPALVKIVKVDKYYTIE